MEKHRQVIREIEQANGFVDPAALLPGDGVLCIIKTIEGVYISNCHYNSANKHWFDKHNGMYPAETVCYWKKQTMV